MTHSDAEKSPIIAPSPQVHQKPNPRLAQALRANLLRRKQSTRPQAPSSAKGGDA